MPVKWRTFQDFSKNLRSALQLEGFVDALFVSSSMAQLCKNGHRKRHRAKYEVPRLKIHRRGAFKHSLDSPFGQGLAGWLVGHLRPPFSQKMSARHLNNKMTRNPPLPQGPRSRWRTPKRYVHMSHTHVTATKQWRT